MTDVTWLLVGFAGQGCFAARFLIQWVASERRRRIVVPPAFWVLSLAGAVVTLAYGLHRHDPVIITAQATGLLVFSRNLQLDLRHRARWHARRRTRPG